MRPAASRDAEVLDATADGSSSASNSKSSRPAAAVSGWSPDGLVIPQVADLATLSALLVLQPAFLLSHLPPEMHAMGGSLAAALLAAQRLAAAVGDRGSLLVAQDLGVAVSAMVRTSQGGSGRQAGGSIGSGGSNSAAESWLQRAAAEAESAAQLDKLLPAHRVLATWAAGSNSSSGGSEREKLTDIDSSSSSHGGCGDSELDDGQVLLLRVHELSAWCASEQYQQVMAAAKPLRKLLQRSRVPSA